MTGMDLPNDRGNFPGLYDPAQITALNDGPASMYVDYVRLYVKE